VDVGNEVDGAGKKTGTVDEHEIMNLDSLLIDVSSFHFSTQIKNWWLWQTGHGLFGIYFIKKEDFDTSRITNFFRFLPEARHMSAEEQNKLRRDSNATVTTDQKTLFQPFK
jgi:hypothetical protein